MDACQEVYSAPEGERVTGAWKHAQVYPSYVMRIKTLSIAAIAKKHHPLFLYAGAFLLMSVAISAGLRLTRTGQDELFFYCGAGLRPAADEIVGMFTAQTGVKVRTDYGPSSILLGRIKVSGEGDLFMPGDESYVREAQELGLVYESRSAASWVPVIMVRAGNPKNIRGLPDLTEPGLKLALADERTAAVGRIARLLFDKNMLSSDDIEKNLVYEGVAVHDLATAVHLGHVDAAIVWGPVAAAYDEAEIVFIPAEENIVSPIPIAVLSFSSRKRKAQEFADFMLSEKGRDVFIKHHYGGIFHEE